MIERGHSEYPPKLPSYPCRKPISRARSAGCQAQPLAKPNRFRVIDRNVFIQIEPSVLNLLWKRCVLEAGAALTQDDRPRSPENAEFMS